jgi:hypothetical protein
MKNPNDQYKNPDSSLKGSSFYSVAIDDDDLLNCFVHSPDQAGIPFVLDYETTADAQTRDAKLQQLAQREPTKFVELHVCTDHKNITFSRLNTQRVLRWRLFLEEHAPMLHCVKGETNTLADALSLVCLFQRGRENKIT